ncbi:hypothetical protein C0993_006328, partial [Termitomyces sp. T159_Od127]
VPMSKIVMDGCTKSQTERAVQELKESAEQLRAEWVERQKALEDLWQDINADANVGAHDLDWVITVLGMIEDTQNTDPMIDPKALRTLEDAMRLTDWPEWEAVSNWQKIFKGCPVFTIKQNKKGQITCFKT